MKNDFIPRKDNDLLVWHDKFLAGATANAAALGLTPAEVGDIQGDNDDLHNYIRISDAADAAAKAATATKNAAIKTVVAHARTKAKRMKTATTYTEALGDTVGIEGAEDTTDLSTSKPTLTATNKGHGNIEIGFDKSISEGVNLYCLREGETVSTFLARDTISPYVDNRPLLVPGKPEVREYRAVYILNDAEIGEPSDEAVITATP